MDKKETARVRVSVGAVVFRDDTVLVVTRGKAPLKGQWSIPGGKVEYGEKLTEAVRREVMEETGLEIDVTGQIGVFESLPQKNGGEHHYVMIDYAAEWIAGEPVAADDAEAAEFVSIEEAKARLSWDETRRALQEALKIRNGFKEMP